MGGCFGGVLGPLEPLSQIGPVFFYLLCLDNYSKTFQKRRIFEIVLEGAHVGVPPWGGPPRPLGPPQGPLSVIEFWKKLQQFKNII